MRIFAAYLLAVLGGNAAPDAAAVNKILESVGASAEADSVNTFLEQMSGKDVWELISSGSVQLDISPYLPIEVAKRFQIEDGYETE